MMSFAEFCAETPVQVVGVNGVVDMVGKRLSYESIRHKFEQQVQPTDLIYYYCSEQARWDTLMGSEGFILVRNEEIVDSFVLRMN